MKKQNKICYLADIVERQSPVGAFYPSFRMYFNLLALLVHTSLIMKRAPVFRTGSLAFVAFNLNKMG